MTATSTGTALGFDLTKAIDEAVAEWPAADRAGLVAAIRTDARALVTAELGADSPDLKGAIETVESRMLANFLAELRQPSTLPPPDSGPIDLVAEIGRIVPFLEPAHCRLLAGELYPQLEQLVGCELTRGMSREQLDEFGYFVDRDMDRVSGWLAVNLPDFESLDEFKELLAAGPAADREEVIADFAANQWLALHRPDYPQVARAQLRLLLRALQNLSEEVGEEMILAWALMQERLIDVFRRTGEPQEAAALLASRVTGDDGVAILHWARLHAALNAMDQRAAALGQEPSDAR